MSSFNVSYQWLPIIDRYRYRPLPVSVDFLQNLFDLIFIQVFIWYWNWGPLLVVLYYVIETLVMCFFTSLKWWKSKKAVSDDQVSSKPMFKALAILCLGSVVSIFSYGQIEAVHDVLGLVMTLPSWETLWKDDQQFMIGVLAILLQQTLEYYKYHMQHQQEEVELARAIWTPVLRIFIQQFTVMFGIFLVVAVSFLDLKVASVMIALVLGVIKLVSGQVQLILIKK